uniref:Sodium/glucose cotransporter 1 n=1 Tax=Schistocephalus solidus TaxID=70667 RepID=A0A0X3PN86_SCHSO
MNISMYPAVIILLVISALFTIMGGLTAVIWTDFAQTVIMIAGAIYLMIRSFQVTGGFDGLVINYFNGIPNTTRAYQSTPFMTDNPTSFSPDLYGTDADRNAVLFSADPSARNQGIYAECSIAPADAMNLFKSITSTDLPWLGAIFGLTVNATWYWCTDQVIVQRVLAAKNLTHARGGIILACLIKMTPLWLMVVPGMVARILFADEVMCGSAPLCQKICGKTIGCTDIAYPSLVLNLLPSGARGLMLAVMMASLVSSLTSIFNSTSTIFTVDIWSLIRPRARDAELMIVGRVCVIILVGIGIAWIPIVQLSDELFDYIQSVTAYLAPPICAVYVLAIFWKRTNEISCFVALVCGLIIGLTRFIWEISYGKTPCGEISTNPPHFLVQVHYLHFSILLFGISFLLIVGISLVTPPLPSRYTRRLVFSERWTEFDPKLDGPKLQIVSESEKQAWIEEGEAEKPKLSCWKKTINWLCGIEKMQDSREPVYTQEEADEILETTRRQLSLVQKPKDAIAVNIAEAVVVGICIFIWGFFS